MALIAKASDPSVRVRFPKKLIKEIDRLASQSGRSRNSEIVHRLSESLKPGQGSPLAALAD